MGRKRTAWLGAALLLGACGASGLPPELPDPELAALAEGAHAAFAARSYPKAEALFRRALDHAWAMDEAKTIASLTYNLAICLVQQGRRAEARSLLTEAMAELDLAGADLAAPLLASARLAAVEEEWPRALALVERLLADPRARPDLPQRAQARLLLAEAALAAGELDRARAEADAAASLLDEDPALVGLAGLAAVRGRLHLQAGEPGRGAERFDEEAELLRKAGRFPEMAAALERAGRAFAGAGQRGTAAGRLFRAARARAGQGEAEEARRLLEEAATLARAAGEGVLLARIERLQRELAAPAGS